MLRAPERSGPAIALALGALVACKGGKDQRYAKAAEEEFSKTFSCPASSITVTPRPDLKAYDLQVTPTSPPAEVAADPARLAEWKRREEKGKEGYDGMSVYHASGCGHAAYYTCSLATSTNEQQVIACSTAQHPPK